MTTFGQAALDFFAAAPGTRDLVLDYHRRYRCPRERSVKLAEFLNELLLLKCGTEDERVLADDDGIGSLARLMNNWLEAARMHVNFRRVADRLLYLFGPRAARAAPAPSVN